MLVELYPFLRVKMFLDLMMFEEGRGFHDRPRGVGIIYNSGPLKKVGEIGSVSLLVEAPPPGFRLRVRKIRLRRRPPPVAAIIAGRPIVDALGQLSRADWPGKERTPGPEIPAPRPPKMPPVRPARKHRASRFFRVETDGGKSWLVSPNGVKMFSSGVTCVRPWSEGPVQGTERLYRWLPSPREREYAPAVGRDAKGRPRRMSFYTANLIRRYGGGWRQKWASLACDRLAGWGFNTIGNWSDHLAHSRRLLPYTLNAAWWDVPRDRSVFLGFPDVFSTEFEKRCDEAARAMVRPSDSLLIGYFIHNEPGWGGGRVNIAERALSGNKAPATKRRFQEWMRKRGRNARQPGATDLAAFRGMMLDRYFKVACGALRRHDPGHLLMGVRFAGSPPAWMLPPMKYMDVVTVNNYEQVPNPALMDRLHRATGKPLLIGEFHFGATDRGMTFYGLQGAASQRDRGLAFARYMEAAAAIPYVLGAHWFQYADQPMLGRYDGENYNIGMVDVCDRPYPEITAAARGVNPLLPLIHAGKRKPRDLRPRYAPTGLVW